MVLMTRKEALLEAIVYLQSFADEDESSIGDAVSYTHLLGENPERDAATYAGEKGTREELLELVKGLAMREKF